MAPYGIADMSANPQPDLKPDCATVAHEATPASHQGDQMAKRRFQSPKPFKEGNFWWLRVWDTNQTGSRKRQTHQTSAGGSVGARSAEDRRRETPADEPGFESDLVRR